MRQRFSAWLEIQVQLVTSKEGDAAYEDIREQGQEILQQLEQTVRELGAEPIYSLVVDMEYEGEVE